MEENKENKDNRNNYQKQPNKIMLNTTSSLSSNFVDFNKFNQHPISLDCNNEKDTTYIFAMGGVEEIGKNMYVIEHNEETIVVDSGIKFASNDLLGFNGLIPNFEYFDHNNREIDKLMITHGHEDHIGGVPYLVQKCNIKTICGPLLAVEFIKRKLSEFKEIKIPEFEIFSDETIISTKYFTIDFFRVCHSIPDCFGLAIKSPDGNIVSAGDYRFDFGSSTDDTNIHKIIEISNRGVDVFLAESTNSDQPGFSDSEDIILKNIGYILKTTKSRVFISTFASNLGRIERIIEIAINLNRKICIMGRSMEANIKTSRKVGYIKLSDIDFVNGKEISSTPDENLLVILTGSQGEEMAALNLMSENKYSKITLKPSDTILLSSSPIPGNFKNVENVVNKLFKLGVNVIQHNNLFKIHASGHATKQEQQMMIKIIKPNFIVPIHGESKMLKSMKTNSLEVGFKDDQILIVRNGQKLKLKNKVLTNMNVYIDVSPILIDGNLANKESVKLLEDRKIIAEDGVFNVIISIDRIAHKVLKKPMLSTRGCFYAKESTALVSKISYTIKDELEQIMEKSNVTISDEEISTSIKKTINYFIWKNKKKRPLILISIFG